MKTSSSRSALTDPALAAKLSNEEWVALHVPRFKGVGRTYKVYAGFLEKVLLQARKRLAPTAIVEVRAKGIPSFADKLLRKRGDYQDPKDPLPPDPLVRLTDLCGGRVVTQTAEEVRKICRFVEAAFDIDRPNSEDVSQRLKPTEFGYRSVHYIVQVNSEKLKAAGINTRVPPELLGFAPNVLGSRAAGRPLKAEIQVRTLLEHAAAALGHDTLYKTDLRVPDRIKRHHATLAAMLEGVDSGFGQLLGSLKEFRSSYGAYHEREAVVEEIARLRIVLVRDPKNVLLAVRIAQHALAIGHHETAEAVLGPYREHDHFGVQRALGQTLTEMHWENPRSPKFLEGRRLLENSCAHPPKDSEALCLLAESLAREDNERARELFHEAIQADASEPVTLSRYLEFEISRLNNDHAVHLAAPMIRNAMDRCRKQIEAHANLPAAWSSLAVFHLLVGEPFEALNAVAHVAALCQGHGQAGRADDCECGRTSRPCAAGRALSRLRDTLRRLHCIREKLAGYDWCERAVLLCLAVRVADAAAAEALKKLASPGSQFLKPGETFVFLAGGCSVDLESSMNIFRAHLQRGMEGLRFTLISGGTRIGISGVAGHVAARSEERIRAIGYIPAGQQGDEKRFARLVQTPGTDFTPLDPLQAWCDLIAAGVDAAKVKVLSYAGRRISSAECALAVALGARVGIVENSALPQDRQFLDPEWSDRPNLVRLPMDAMTFRAFLLVDELPIDAKQQKRLERAARKAHEDYVASATPRDLSLKKWDDLDEALKLSNYHQVAYWEQMLKEHGLSVRRLVPGDNGRKPLSMERVLGRKGIRKLAEMEHGRWNVERLLRGWHHAEDKDVLKKLNPCLAPWPKLTKIKGINYQNYDLDAVRGLPTKLREVGLELFRK